MRIALGLVSLLVVLGIIMLLFSTYQAPMLKRGKTAMDDSRQIAGRDEDNAPVTHAITLDAQDRNGQMEGAVVTTITPGSTIEKHYGLQKGDVILVLGQLQVKGNMQSADEAKDYLLYAYQRNEPLVVMRGFEQLTLPLDPAAVAAAAAAAAAASTGTSAPPPQALGTPAADPSQAAAPQETAAEKPKPKKPGGLEGQLDLIRNIPGQ